MDNTAFSIFLTVGVPTMLTVISGVWYLSFKMSRIESTGTHNTAAVEQLAKEQDDCNRHHEQEMRDLKHVQVDHGNRITKLETIICKE